MGSQYGGKELRQTRNGRTSTDQQPTEGPHHRSRRRRHGCDVPHQEPAAERNLIRGLQLDLSPGGKGVSQAVAAARLGLDASLIAAIDDRFGHEIINYLHDEGVNTSLLKLIPRARTPFTGIIEKELGDSAAVNWRNQMEVDLGTSDIEDVSHKLVDCDAILVTFEIPVETMQRTLALAHRSASTAHW